MKCSNDKCDFNKTHGFCPRGSPEKMGCFIQADGVPDSAPMAGSVSDFEMSPELKELLDNTPVLTDEDIAELGEANRKLGLPWWKRLLETLKQNILK